MQDLRFALRLLRRGPGFAAIAIATLALGVGLNSAVFGIVNVLLFRGPAVSDPDRLVWMVSASTEPGGRREGPVTYPDYLDFRARRDVVTDALAYIDMPVALGDGRQAVRIAGQLATANMFQVLGVSPAVGPGFRGDEDRAPGAASVAVIGDALWRRMFGGDPAVVGRAVTINGHPFTIAGVAPARFIGPDVFTRAEIWVPFMMHEQVVLHGGRGRGDYWLRAIARLAPAVSIERAEATLHGVASAIASAYPDSHDDVTVALSPVGGAGPHEREAVATISALLLGVTGVVLLIACANVANLLLARGASRQREIGVRLALGASRGRVVRQLLAESALLAVGGGAAGLLLALWGADALVRFAAVPIETPLIPDGRVLAFTTATALATALLFGLAPALRASRTDLVPSLKEGDPGSGRARASRLQRALVVGQLALSLVLLAGAGLLIRSLLEAHAVDVGFGVENRVTVGFDLALQGYSADKARAFSRDLLARARALPGVRAASLGTVVPMGGRVYFTDLRLSGRPVDPDGRQEIIAYNHVWPGFFETLDIEIVRGRTLLDSDMTGTPRVAVVSEAMAQRYWPSDDAIGRRFALGRGPEVEIVGVARDVLLDEYLETARPYAYLPHAGEAGDLTLVVWSATGGNIAPLVVAALKALDPNLPIVGPRTIEEHLADRMDGERALSKLLGVAGTLALVLAALGLYGIVAYTVARRTREIGVRIALGAEAHDVVRLFVAEGLRLSLAGVLLGLLPAVAVTYLLRGMLVGIGVGDPPTLAACALILGAVAAAASLAPSWRAARVDPTVALRAE
jgi:predicted permease